MSHALLHGPQRGAAPNYPPRKVLPPQLAEALSHARVQSGMTFRQAAARVGIDASYLCKLTRGTRCPSQRVVERLAEVLPIDEETLAGLRTVAVVRRVGSWGKGDG